MADKEQEIRLHQQKWKKWNQQRKNESIKKNINVEENLHNYVVKLTQKLGEPVQNKKKMMDNNKQIVNKLGDEIESNSCGICLQIMVPPQIPMILFPCGHNLCKMCLFENAHQRKQKYKLKVNKCPICRAVINNYAQNRNLMTLICTYTNNKHLLQKQLEEEEQAKDQSSFDDINQLRIRCEVLSGQKKILEKDLLQQKKEKNIIDEVIEKFMMEKKRNKREMEELEAEARLIDKHLEQKVEVLEGYKKNIQYTEEKKRIIEKTLEPLSIQKEKLQLLEAARLINEK